MWLMTIPPEDQRFWYRFLWISSGHMAMTLATAWLPVAWCRSFPTSGRFWKRSICSLWLCCIHKCVYSRVRMPCAGAYQWGSRVTVAGAQSVSLRIVVAEGLFTSERSRIETYTCLRRWMEVYGILPRRCIDSFRGDGPEARLASS